ncbi:2-succinyl-5-enolpyruvyl-6-hydroxy-3-cyclohexene-1-carboxylic-acid synthase [Winogradskyella ursingii]|uniref:2-succinyl-5-enolpyruvyl-6-hydroxy-3- cyclohexene-1-carboxylic-acid synthase n=1 Tax=Winogradskyella ursingii TaxID=2686079 RepID=UPI0015CA4E56|nr:2-succinyl-5-enolpyruvyl-6-hydroxy-3-cyclohexene-1-carboxylic-acid synthase [Winogradskyella ursingii]
MIYSKIPLAQTTVTLCKAHNIKHIVISPGSRNAPLTISFTNDEFFECYSIVDERCAAFFALGIAQQTQECVAIVCTSGSALLNYYPAIAEAFYSQIPLVVLSADRPPHLIGIGDGQTIKQKNIYGEHVYYSANLKLDEKKEAKFSFNNDVQSFNETEINEALTTAVLKSGPVHINVPFDEPLYETVDELSINPKPFQYKTIIEEVNQTEIKALSDKWQEAKRKMILVGVLQPNSIEVEWLQKIADDNSVLVFTETTSNLHHPDFLSGIDKIIAPLNDEEFQDLQPTILLTFGGLIVSKKIKAFLRKYQPKHHWHVGLQKANDTFFCLEKHIKLLPNTFLSAFLPENSNFSESNYKSSWLKLRSNRRKKHSEYLETIPFSDFKAFDIILKHLPKNSQLQVGNSSAIRYTQLFQFPRSISVFCNRGTSGIDGSTSTAIGAAVASRMRITFITGDLSFFYDSNAMWNNYIPNDFRIIVVNNGGGGIFRILPGHKNTDNFDTYFETKHHLTARELCKMYSFDYSKAENASDLDVEFQSFYNTSEQPKLLEVFTPSTLNDEVLLNYFKFLK